MSLALKTTEWDLANTTDLHDSWLLIFLIFSVFSSDFAGSSSQFVY